VQKQFVVALIIIILMSFNLFSITVGNRIPPFFLESGDNKYLNSDELRNKVIFFFYDHKDSFLQNNEFKKQLFMHYHALTPEEQNLVAIVQVIDCVETNMLNRFFWKRSLVKKSKEYEFRIWGDWDGVLKKSYNFRDGESYMLVVDRNGKVIYFDEQLFDWTKIRQITEMVMEILLRKDCR